MIHVLSSLQVVGSDQICLHEDHEPGRLQVTCKAMTDQGVLLHPPLAKRMRDGRYLILDGAHRSAAMRQIGCRYLPVQVVDDSRYQLTAWDHLVPIGTWLYWLQHDAAFDWQGEPLDIRHLAEMIYPSGKRLFVYPSGSDADTAASLSLWHRLVRAYSSKYPVKRVPQDLPDLPEEGMVRLCYPAFPIEHIEEIVAAGQVMPAGVTRFLINGRLLNLRIPLSLFTSSHFPVQEWENYLRHWENSLRLYAEPVYLNEKEFAEVAQV
ncbi:ParB N-terminal domain-containing protein [Brevibacillus sp. GCM10020057]|uniref:ParB N-terminal domain-containing protein n=1 Tax=Brevibacillus sp. GCM10020057 TaxID=3317327 RepID=UPI0036373CC3